MEAWSRLSPLTKGRLLVLAGVGGFTFDGSMLKVRGKGLCLACAHLQAG